MAVAATVMSPVLAGCTTNSEFPTSSISLTKTNCYGPCAAYQIELFSDGRYKWEGRAYVSANGARRGTLGVKTYREAAELLSDSHFQDFRDKYEGAADCETWVTDQQTIVIAVKERSSSKPVTHYLGCQGFERENALLQLEGKLVTILRIEELSR